MSCFFQTFSCFFFRTDQEIPQAFLPPDRPNGPEAPQEGSDLLPAAQQNEEEIQVDQSSEYRNFWNRDTLSPATQPLLSSQLHYSRFDRRAELSRQGSLLALIVDVFRGIIPSSSNENETSPPISVTPTESTAAAAENRQLVLAENLNKIKHQAFTTTEPSAEKLFPELNETFLNILRVKESCLEKLLSDDSWSQLLKHVELEKESEMRYAKAKKLLSTLHKIRGKLQATPKESIQERYDIYKNQVDGYWNDAWKLIYYYHGEEIDNDPITYDLLTLPFSIPHDSKTRAVFDASTIPHLKNKNPFNNATFENVDIRFEKELWVWAATKEKIKEE